MYALELCCVCGLFFEVTGPHRDLKVLTHSVPTRRSSDLEGVSSVAPTSGGTVAENRTATRAASHRPTTAATRQPVTVGRPVQLGMAALTKPPMIAPR